MEQVIALAKVSLTAVQIYMSGVCHTACVYERMGVDGYYESRIRACVCRSVLPLDTVFALKLEQPLRGVGPVPVERADPPSPPTDFGYLFE